MSGQTPEEIEAQVNAQREQLADTVDQLTTKLDVKAHARATAADLKARATTDSGSPRPELMAAAGSLVALLIVVAWWWRRR
jgi:hypothetical protein